MSGYMQTVTHPVKGMGKAFYPFAAQTVSVEISTGDTATKGNICVFNITQAAEGDTPTFSTANNSATGLQRCYGIALESGTAGQFVTVQVAGTVKANIEGKDSDNVNTAVNQLDYVWTDDGTAAGSEDQVLRKALSGDRLFAQVCASAANNIGSNTTGTAQIVILNPFNHVTLP